MGSDPICYNGGMKIIGITGTTGAGKGTVVEYLETKGYKHWSVREFLTKEAERRGMKKDRGSLTIIANDLRSKFSPSYIIEELYKKAEEYGNDSVIESVRAIAEVEFLRKKTNFYLFGVDADPELRFQRVKKRGLSTDHVTYEEFIRHEKSEISNEPTKQNLLGCLALADFKFTNNGTKEDLFKQVEDALVKMA